MIDDLSFLAQPLGPIGPGGAKIGPSPPKPSGPSFEDVLQQRLAPTPLKLSAHAQQRLTSRAIQFNDQEWAKIHQGVEKAAGKGAKEALILTDKAALVVSVKNRTVITAIDKNSLKDNVFTNIDSAVVV